MKKLVFKLCAFKICILLFLIGNVYSQELKVTGEHPFYSYNQNDWVKVKDLSVGDKLLTANGEVTIIKSIKKVVPDSPVKVYNLQVGGVSNYYAGGALVHNKPNNPENKKFNPNFELIKYVNQLDKTMPLQARRITGIDYMYQGVDNIEGIEAWKNALSCRDPRKLKPDFETFDGLKEINGRIDSRLIRDSSDTRGLYSWKDDPNVKVILQERHEFSYSDISGIASQDESLWSKLVMQLFDDTSWSFKAEYHPDGTTTMSFPRDIAVDFGDGCVINYNSVGKNGKSSGNMKLLAKFLNNNPDNVESEAKILGLLYSLYVQRKLEMFSNAVNHAGFSSGKFTTPWMNLFYDLTKDGSQYTERQYLEIAYVLQILHSQNPPILFNEWIFVDPNRIVGVSFYEIFIRPTF